MSFYLDSSVTVCAVSAEAATTAVLDWIGNVDAGLMVSDWVITETFAAISQKRRMKIISADDQRRALAAFEAQLGSSLPVVEVTRGNFRRAARLADNARTALRAGDALHLAVAEHHDFTVCTLDKRQAAAGAAFGVKTLLLCSG